ncbi:MAG TPA: type IV pilus assembly protein PilM [Oligoflexia bacterium]|nr:type IV pilus assembly protein PilM [Oligoflexia bacterium]HMP49342.1 type IV pilus assembly protein PilM [Oligoflexia bacterium]
MKFFEEIFGAQSKKPVVGVDIGSHSIKVAELKKPSLDKGKTAEIKPKPEITAIGTAKLPANAFQGAMPSKKEVIGDVLIELLESKKIDTKRVAFSLPSSAVFTKKISLSKTAAENLEANITFEASNYIPHRIDAINLDYYVLDDSGSSTTDVLLVAVKHEILDTYRSIFELAGLEPVIADVESFAAYNCFELSLSDALSASREKTIALVDFGFRHSTITLIHKGLYLMSGDLAVGCKNYLEAIKSGLDVNQEQSEILLSGGVVPGTDTSIVGETIDKTTAHVVSELQRQIGFFWNGAGIDSMVEEVWLLGGGVKVPRLKEEINSNLGMACQTPDIISAFNITEAANRALDASDVPVYAVALGLGLRRSSDKTLKDI